MARRRFLKHNIENETVPYNTIAPTSGFFSYGEFFTNKCNEFLNQSMTILALSESSEKIENLKLEDEKIEKTKNSTIKALSHLINITTQELEEQKNKAIEASKIKDTFLANMSHELKTPLNSINIISSVMIKNRQQNLSNEQIKNLSIINKSDHFLLHMINDVLDISKLESNNMDINIDKIDVQKLINEIIDMFTPQFKEKEINLLFQLDNKIDFIYSDEIRVKQILKNLISNALKFTHKGNVILSIQDSNENITILVEDQGIGIEKNKLEYIFDRFKQADDSTTKKYGGTGLGLAITKELIKLLNGTITIKSIVDKGTKIEIKIPKNKNFITHLNNLDLKKDKKDSLLVLNDDPIYFFDLIIALQKDFEIIQTSSIEDLINKYKQNRKQKVIVNLSKIDKNSLDLLKEAISSNLILLDENKSENNVKGNITIMNKSTLLKKCIESKD